MLRLFITFIFLLTSSAHSRVELKVGDILLQPTDCWSCTLIEEQEDTIYSHIGIVLSVNPIMVAEARGKVQLLSLKEFNKITQKNQSIAVLRFRNSRAVAELESNQEELMELFKREFEGLKYDHDFIWNNLDQNGREMLYCSEMVAKLLQAFMGLEPIVKRMRFDKNVEQWKKYFKGEPPNGKWGNAPADFDRSELFYTVGEL